MGNIEEEFLEMVENQGNPKPTVWMRYINDVLVIWSHSKNLFREFFNKLNNFHPTIKYTYELSNQAVNFLDITIFKGKRFSDLHIQYLHFDSCHPPHTFKGLILGKAIRLLRASRDPTSLPKPFLSSRKPSSPETTPLN